ncbi:hypothetical protein [Halalkalicoccus salilacus]|uniref:hypothetical protein n=1 Tax=Halalkalicoccus TaxID=332246 RepID=UPI002F964180
MVEHTATFEIESASDARSVSRVLDDLQNRLREEELEVREGETVINKMLEEFKTLQTNVAADSTGQLRVTYKDETSVE